MSIGAVGGIGGGYDSETIAQMRQNMFNKMDEDGDGVISATECQNAATTISQETGLSVSADEMMSIFDLDGDGSITQAEQTEASPAWEQHMASLMEEAGMSPMGPPPSQSDEASESSDLLDQIFSAMDTNQDGTVDQTEYNAAMEQIMEALSGSNASDTSSSSTTDSSTTVASSTDSSTTTTSSTDSSSGTSSESSLMTLIQQLIENMLSMEKYQQEYPFPGSQDSSSTSSYA